MDDDYEPEAQSDGSDLEDQQQQSGNDNNGAGVNNKLQHNIAKKGANSYYYAHKKKADAPTVRNEPPQLLDNAKEINIPKAKPSQPFEKYAWTNGNKTVTLYITHPKAETIIDGNIHLTTEKKGFHLKVEDDNGSYSLKLDKLYADIDGAEIKKKTDKFVLTLKKVEEKTWYRLEE